MEQFLSFFKFDIIEIISLIVLSLLAAITIFYYLFFYAKPLRFHKKKENKEPNIQTKRLSVSVIIVAKNESENLAIGLPQILTQDYPDYEVIVVNDGSTDESDVILKGLNKNNPHLYHTFLPSHTERDKGRKKLALTIGIKAAKNEILLFTEANVTQFSPKWIASMIEQMTDDKDIVLGYSYFSKSKKFFSRIADFDNFIYSLQYLSMALLNKPYIGTYRNIAYRKNLFFENKGFSSYLNLEHGEEVFLHGIMGANNTAICTNEDSFVAIDIPSFSRWKEMKIIYKKIKSDLRKFSTNLFTLESSLRYIFYAIFILILIHSSNTKNWICIILASLIYLIKITIQLVTINKSAKYFHAKNIYFSFIFTELLQPIYNTAFNLLSKKK